MITPKTIYLQEDFLKENIAIHVRSILDRRNIANANETATSFAS